MALGVEVVLLTPTRDFLDDERGVMLLLRNGLTGVTSSCAAGVVLGVLPTVLRTVLLDCRLLVEASEGASRGGTGVFAVRFVASVGFKGRPLLFVVRSGCIVRPRGRRIRGRCEVSGGWAWSSVPAMGGCLGTGLVYHGRGDAKQQSTHGGLEYGKCGVARACNGRSGRQQFQWQ